MSRVGNLFRLLLITSSAVLLAACAVEQGRVQRAPESAPATPSAPLPPLSPAPPSTATPQPPLILRPQPPPPGGFPKTLAESGAAAAVQSLARQAQDARAAGKNDVALNELQRALRIAPKNAFVWQALADAHLASGDADDAEAAAKKSSALGRGNPYLDSVNWRLIAGACAARGDGAGARLANARADLLSASLGPAQPSPLQ